MRLFRFLFWGWVLVIVFLMVKPMDGSSRFDFPGVDKLVHYSLFFVLGLLYEFSLTKTTFLLVFWEKTRLFYFVFFFTLLIEFIQLFLSYRSFDLLDLLMNLLGLFSGLNFARFFLRKVFREGG